MVVIYLDFIFSHWFLSNFVNFQQFPSLLPDELVTKTIRSESINCFQLFSHFYIEMFNFKCFIIKRLRDKASPIYISHLLNCYMKFMQTEVGGGDSNKHLPKWLRIKEKVSVNLKHFSFQFKLWAGKINVRKKTQVTS